MPRARIAAASLVFAVVVGGTLWPVAGAAGETTPRPGSLSTIGQRTGPLPVPVPAGVTPSAVSAVISADRVVEGASVAVLINGRVAASVPSSLYTRVSVPVGPTDVNADGALGLSLRYDGPPGSLGCETPPAVTLRRIGLDYTGVETAPTTVAEFFPDGASRIDVRLPPEPGDDLLEAALTAVAALSARYGADTPVELSTTDVALPSATAGQRVVQLAPATEGVTTSLTTESGVPALLLSGAASPLVAASAALAADTLGLADSAETQALASRPQRRSDSLTRTLGELQDGAPAPSASASGTVEVPLRPDSFGGPVSSMQVHLEGTHSAVPTGVSARLDVYVDDTLVSSTGLGADPMLDLDFDLRADLVRSGATLRATISSATALGPATTPGAVVQCSPGLPFELALDTAASTVTATRGTGDGPGLQLFPPVLAGRLPVAIAQDGPTRVDGAIDAARLISAVQRQADTPLDVSLVEPAELLGSDRSGLLVGADAAVSQSVGAPLTLAGTRTLDTARATFQVRSDKPFAALQAVRQEDRVLLLLGSWAPDDTVAAPNVSHRVTQRVLDDGWASLEGDVLLLEPGGGPLTVDTGAPAVGPEPTESAGPAEAAGEETSYLRWFALPVIVLTGLLALQLGRLLRRRSQRAVADRAWAGAPNPPAKPDDVRPRPSRRTPL